MRIRPLLLCLLLSSACASTPNVSPVGSVALYGGKTLEGIHAIQKAVAAAEEAKLVSTDSAAKVMIVAYQAGETGQKLADVLALYDAAVGPDKTQLIPKIEALVRVIEDTLTEMGRTEGMETVKQVTDLIANVLTTLRQLRAAIPGLELKIGSREAPLISPAYV